MEPLDTPAILKGATATIGVTLAERKKLRNKPNFRQTTLIQ